MPKVTNHVASSVLNYHVLPHSRLMQAEPRPGPRALKRLNAAFQQLLRKPQYCLLSLCVTWHSLSVNHRPEPHSVLIRPQVYEIAGKNAKKKKKKKDLAPVLCTVPEGTAAEPERAGGKAEPGGHSWPTEGFGLACTRLGTIFHWCPTHDLRRFSSQSQIGQDRLSSAAVTNISALRASFFLTLRVQCRQAGGSAPHSLVGTQDDATTLQ